MNVEVARDLSDKYQLKSIHMTGQAHYGKVRNCYGSFCLIFLWTLWTLGEKKFQICHPGYGPHYVDTTL